MKTLREYAAMTEKRLDRLLPERQEGVPEIGSMPPLLAKSMRYSLMAGGKRLRPSMMLACIDMLCGEAARFVDFAAAVEMIHTYSLIHDDLPGMDNDTLRRGRPTNHVVFGEGEAILAGDGLLNLAFETMLGAALTGVCAHGTALSAIREIAVGCGVTGMIGGQSMDLSCERGAYGGTEALEYIHHNKTARMFIHPLRAAAILAGGTEEQISAIGEFGRCYGLLFQAVDDLLDVTGDPAAMGKTLGKDEASGKLTCISAFGLEGTRRRISDLRDRALTSLSVIDADTTLFAGLTEAAAGRDH